MTEIIQIAALCAVFADPGFYYSEVKQDRICKLLPTVVQQAEENDIDPFLLMGLITVESNWTPTAESWAHACGLTQVIPKYTGGPATKGKKYTCDQLKRPTTGIEAGARILSWWVTKYGEGHVPTGLCGYFSGFRCKPKIHKKGESYYKKVFNRKNKIETLYDRQINLRYPERRDID